MGKITKTCEVLIAELKPYERNAKIHNEYQLEKLCDSINEFGFLNPCIIDKEKNVIAGHGRIMAAEKLGWEKVPCVYVEGLTDEQRRAYILADNKLSELAEWDMDLVSEELSALKDEDFNITITGFSINDIQFTDEMQPDITEAEVEEIKKKEPRIKQGEIWKLGNHTLMCGDSTNLDDVEKLVGGAVIDLLLTDPPYNVAIENSDGMSIENDDMGNEEFYEFLRYAFEAANVVMKEGAPFYVWYASKSATEFLAALKDTGLEPKQQLIWVKNHFTLSRQDYNWRHEPCLYGWKEGAAHYFIDIHSFDTVQEPKINEMSRDECIEYIKELTASTTAMYEDRPNKDDLHPTMKPLDLTVKMVRNSSRDGDNVLDLFGGSGTTLIACEKMDRNCYMMEYDPQYAEVIIERWEKYTGEEAKKA